MNPGSRVFAMVAGTALAIGGLELLACSSSDEAPLPSFDAAPAPPPGPCLIAPSSTLLCEAGAPSGNTCLVTSDTSIACPSAVAGLAAAAGRGATTDLVVTQRRVGHSNERGFFENDTHGYVQQVHLDGHGGGVATLDPIPPLDYPTESTVTTPFLGMLAGGTTADPALVVMTNDSTGATSLKTERLVAGAPPALGAPFVIPGTFRPTFVTSSTGEGMALLAPNGAGKLVLVRGLPDAPRSLPTSLSPDAFVLTTDPSGNPAGLFYFGGKLRLLEGEAFAERWAEDARAGAEDLVYVGDPGSELPAVLTDDGARIIRPGQPSTPYAVLGHSFSTCSRTTYVGVTCDACPTSEHCQTGEDDIRAARLFTRDGRLFAIYYSTDVRRTIGFSLDKTPILGVGCVCATHERDKQEYADSLVVVELAAPTSPGGAMTVVEHMRLAIFKARTTGFLSITPRSDGDVDVIVGAQLSTSWSSALTELPKTPTPFRALRVSTRALPR